MKANLLLKALVFAGILASCDNDPLDEPQEFGFTLVEGDSVKVRKEKLSTRRFSNWESAPLSMVVGDTVLPYQVFHYWSNQRSYRTYQN